MATKTGTGTVFDSLDEYSPDAKSNTMTGTQKGGVAEDAATQNLAAGPDLERLSTLINRINQQANQARVPGGAALEQQSSENIANELAGNLPQSFLDTLRTSMAQRGAGGGFGVDNPNMNAAALRAMGIEASERQARGQSDLSAAYGRAAPLWDVSQGMVTPALVQAANDAAAQRGLDQQRITNQANQAAAALAEQQREFGSTLQQNRDSLAAQMGLEYARLSQQQRQFVDSQAQQLQENQSALSAQAQSLAENARQANMANAFQMTQYQGQMEREAAAYALQQQQIQQQQMNENRAWMAAHNSAQLTNSIYQNTPPVYQNGIRIS